MNLKIIMLRVRSQTKKGFVLYYFIYIKLEKNENYDRKPKSGYLEAIFNKSQSFRNKTNPLAEDGIC